MVLGRGLSQRLEHRMAVLYKEGRDGRGGAWGASLNAIINTITKS